MPRILGDVLSPIDLPEAELRAAMLDGELFAIGPAFGPVDAVERPAHRAAASAASLPPRLIAERFTAAWIHGALEVAPHPHQLCADENARYRLVGQADVVARQVVLEPGDTQRLGGLAVTTPLRTLVDIARVDVTDDGAVLRALASIAALTLEDCLDALDRRRNLPNKLRAAERIVAALRAQRSASAAASNDRGERVSLR